MVAVEGRELDIQASGAWKETKQPVKVIATVKLSNASAQRVTHPYFSLSGKVMESVMKA